MNFYNFNVIVACLFLCFTLMAKTENKNVYYDNEYTFIEIDRDTEIIEIYQYDNSFHPVIGDTILRGKFELKHINTKFYSLSNIISGQDWFNNVFITDNETENNSLNIIFETPNLNNVYKLFIYSKGQHKISHFTFREKLNIELSPDTCGYEFAIVPTSNAFNLLSCFIYGFNNNVKYAILPQLDKNLFTKGHEIRVSIPFLNDNYFQKWIVNNETIKIDKNKIIWNGHVFSPYKQIRKF